MRPLSLLPLLWAFACDNGKGPPGAAPELSSIECPGAACVEVCDDGVDNDVDSYTDCADLDCEFDAACDHDQDGDGHDDVAFGGDDCDDANPDINPSHPELCNGYDDNCNGLIDDEDPTLDPSSMNEWYRDQDGDGYGDPDAATLSACEAPDGAVADNTDCNDNNAGMSPADADVDGWSGCDGDCDVNDPLIYPGAFEYALDCIDNDCDGDHGDPGCFVDLYMVRTSDDMLVMFDTELQTFTDVGPLGTGFDFGEVAWDPTTSTMYMIDGRVSQALWEVDIATGVATFIGAHNISDLFGLAVDPNTGVLYAGTRTPNGFYTLDKVTGAATYVGDPAEELDGMCWDSTRDRLMGLEGGGGNLVEINPATGGTVVLANAGFIDNNGLAYDSNNDLYWAVDWSGSMYTYDPNNAYVRIEVFNSMGSHDGLTAVPSL